MAEKTIKIKSNIKSFPITNEDGTRELAVLRLDPNNDATMGRFMELKDNATNIYNDVNRQVEEAGLADLETITEEQAKQIIKINNDAINGLIEETDNMFGAGFVKKVFAEHYEADPNFLPSMELLTDLYLSIMPVFESVYKNSTKNYSTTKKGTK